MTDLFTVEQGKRLYGFIAVGGSLGSIAGAYITNNVIGGLGPANLVAISATMFAIVCFLVRFFPNNFTRGSESVPAREEPIGGTAWSGITHIARSPYLFGLAAAIMLYTATSTWAYFQQTTLAGQALKTSADRTVFLSNLEIWVNTITVFVQIFFTGRLLKWFGVKNLDEDCDRVHPNFEIREEHCSICASLERLTSKSGLLEIGPCRGGSIKHNRRGQAEQIRRARDVRDARPSCSTGWLLSRGHRLPAAGKS